MTGVGLGLWRVPPLADDVPQHAGRRAPSQYLSVYNSTQPDKVSSNKAHYIVVAKRFVIYYQENRFFFRNKAAISEISLLMVATSLESEFLYGGDCIILLTPPLMCFI